VTESYAEYGGGAVSPGKLSTGKPTLCMINYNGERFLAASLRSAVAQSEWFAELVLIDNASEDGSLEMVRREFPSVRIVQLPENRGPAAARNEALRASCTDLVVLVDNDVSLAPDCIQRLMAALAAHPEAVIAAPTVLHSHDRGLIQYDGPRNHFLGLMSFHRQNVPFVAEDHGPREICSLVSACFLVDPARLPDPEPFDESFFIYMEDHDVGVRLRALGCTILAVPDAHCFNGEGTEGLSVRIEGSYSRRRVFLMIRNRWQFLLKNYSLRSLVLLAPMLVAYELAQLAVVAKKGWISEWFRAAWWIVRHAPSILEKRRRIQSKRKTPDRDLLTDGPIPFRDELTTGQLERVGRQLLNAAVSWYWKRVAHFI
jgi:GT2 family glycosyltransferase